MKKSIYRLLLILPPLVVFLPLLLSGKVLYWGTPYLQFYPWQAEAVAQLQQGVFPWWNPWNGAGAPLAANYQVGIFYPPNWLLYPFYSIGGNAWGAWANTLVLLLHAWIGAFGMARLARQQGFSELTQIIGAMLMPLSGYFISRANFFPIYLAGAWLPWLLCCGQELLEKKHRLVAFIGFSACSGLLFLAGHAQTAMMIFFLALLWIAVLWLADYSKKEAVQAIGLAAVGVVVGLLSAAIQLVPTYEFLALSQRANAVDYQSVFTYSFSPIKLLTLLLPDLFGNPGLGNYIGYATYWEDAVFVGIIPTLLAFFSLSIFFGWRTASNRERAIAVYSTLIIGVGLLFAFGEFTPVYPYLYRSVPGFDMFKAPARWLLLVELGLILLAFLGFERMRRPAGRALFWGRLATAGAGAIAIGALIGIALMKDLPATILTPLLRLSAFGAAFGLLRLFSPQEKQDRGYRLWGGVVYGLIMLDLLLFSVPALPRLPMSILPNRQVDSDQYFSGRIYMAPGTEQQLKIHRFFRFSDFRPLEFVQKAAIIPLPNLNLFAQQPMLNNFDPIVPAEYDVWISALQAADPLLQSELLSISNVKSVVRLDFNLTDGYKYEAIADGYEVKVFTCPVWVKDKQASLDLLTTSIVPNRLILVGEERGDCIPSVAAATVKVEGYNFKVYSEAPGWLFIPMTNYQGWTAKVDSKQVALTPANYLFVAVAVPEGQHYVQLTYRPEWLPGALIASGAAWFGLGLMAIYLRLKKWRTQDDS